MKKRIIPPRNLHEKELMDFFQSLCNIINSFEVMEAQANGTDTEVNALLAKLKASGYMEV